MISALDLSKFVTSIINNVQQLPLLASQKHSFSTFGKRSLPCKKDKYCIIRYIILLNYTNYTIWRTSIKFEKMVKLFNLRGRFIIYGRGNRRFLFSRPPKISGPPPRRLAKNNWSPLENFFRKNFLVLFLPETRRKMVFAGFFKIFHAKNKWSPRQRLAKNKWSPHRQLAKNKWSPSK